MSDKRRWIRMAFVNGALFVTSLILAAGVAEVGVRIAAPQQLILIRPDLWEPADTVGWLRRSNVDARVNTGEGTVRLITDHYGFRVGEERRRTGVPVLLLGDSFMEALQVDHEQSLAGLLDMSLSAATGEPVAVRNAGINGWAPTQYLSRARALLPNEPYRLVITAIYVGNDAQPVRTDYIPPRTQVQRHRFRLPKAMTRREFVDAGLRPVNDILEERSHLFVLLRSQLETLRMRAGLSPLYFPQEFRRSEADAERWAISAQVCRDISDVAAQHGARTLFVLIPADFQVIPEKFKSYTRGFNIDTDSVDLEQPTRRLKEELTSQGLLVLDALPLFRELSNDGRSLYGTVDQHLSEAGHRALADLVTPVAAAILNDQ